MMLRQRISFLLNLSVFYTQFTMSIHFQLSPATQSEMLQNDAFFEIVEPPELEYTFRIRPAKDYGVSFGRNFQPLKNVPLLPVEPKHGCETFTNVHFDASQPFVAMIERGKCSFKTKTLQAEAAGASAAIITDLTSALNEDYFIEMIDDDPTTQAHIPSAFLIGINGLMIKRTLRKLNMNYALCNVPVNLTFARWESVRQPPWTDW